MKECLSEEILQQYFDGELPGERMEGAALHLAGCKACVSAFRELEDENNLMLSALAPEFDVAVPTERLHKRIEAAIAGFQVVNPVHSQPATSRVRSWFAEVFALVSLSPQRAFGYAGLVAVVVFAVIYGITWRTTSLPTQPQNQVASKSPEVVKEKSIPSPVSAPPTSGDAVVLKTPTVVRASKPSRNVVPRHVVQPAADVAEVKLLPGERSYLKTIAQLDTAIKSGNKEMRPALQAEYERNLALVDRAIAATRSAAKRNPNDPDAVEFMFSAYQSKVDLLNTIADARVYNRAR